MQDKIIFEAKPTKLHAYSGSYIKTEQLILSEGHRLLLRSIYVVLPRSRFWAAIFGEKKEERGVENELFSEDRAVVYLVNQGLSLSEAERRVRGEL